jgi:hypothetical protein
VCDQARRHAGAAGDLRERASHETKFGETIERDLDQLLAAVILETLGGRATDAIRITGTAIA